MPNQNLFAQPAMSISTLFSEKELQFFTVKGLHSHDETVIAGERKSVNPEPVSKVDKPLAEPKPTSNKVDISPPKESTSDDWCFSELCFDSNFGRHVFGTTGSAKLDSITAVAIFSGTDHTYVIEAGEEKTSDKMKPVVRVWSFPEMDHFDVFEGHGDKRVTALATHPGYPYIVSADESGKVIIWDPRVFSNQERKLSKPSGTVQEKAAQSNVSEAIDTDVSQRVKEIWKERRSACHPDYCYSIASFRVERSESTYSIESKCGDDGGLFSPIFSLVITKSNSKDDPAQLSSDTKTTIFQPLFGGTQFDILVSFAKRNKILVLSGDGHGKFFIPVQDPPLSFAAFLDEQKQNPLLEKQNSNLNLVQAVFKESKLVVVTGTFRHMQIWNGDETAFMFSNDISKVVNAMFSCVIHSSHLYPEESSQVFDATRQNSSRVRLLLSAGRDNLCVVWDMERREKIRVLSGHKDIITCIRVCDADDVRGVPPLVLTASADSTCVFWDLLTGIQLRTLHHDAPVLAMDLFAMENGPIVVTATVTGKMRVWDLRHIPRHGEIQSPQKKPIYSMETFKLKSVSGNERDLRVIAGNYYESTQVISPKSESASAKKLECNRQVFCVVAFIFEHNKKQVSWLILSGSHGLAEVWNIDTRERVASLKLYDKEENNNEKEKMKPQDNHRNENETEVWCMAVCDSTTAHGSDTKEPTALLIGGDSNGCVVIWDLAELKSKSSQFADNFPYKDHAKHHNDEIRSIAVHRSRVREDSLSWCVSVSSDCSAVVWNVETLTVLHRFPGVHTGFISCVAVFDPPAHDKSGICHIITAGCDGNVAVIDVDATLLTPSSRSDAVQPNLSCTSVHNDSILAMALHVPENDKYDPLVVTGCVDTSIAVWNMRTKEVVQRLLGHKERVLCIHIPPREFSVKPVVLSSSEDGTVIVWKDALHQHAFFPTNDQVELCFESDLKHDDWPLITELEKKHKHALFVENTILFTLAVEKGRADFLYKFREYLTFSIRHCPKLLSVALKKKDWNSVCAVLLAWTDNLNKDVDDMLEQRLFHAMHLFPLEEVKHLANAFPLQLLHFIEGLRLIRNDQSIIDEKENKTKRILEGNTQWGTFDPSRPLLKVPNKHWVEQFEEFCEFLSGQSLVKAQSTQTKPVSLMAPLRLGSPRVLALLVETSMLCDHPEVFASPVMEIAVKYSWQKRDRDEFLKVMFIYVCFVLFFLSFSAHYAQEESWSKSSPSLGMYVSGMVLLVFQLYYVRYEILQCTHELFSGMRQKEENIQATTPTPVMTSSPDRRSTTKKHIFDAEMDSSTSTLSEPRSDADCKTPLLPKPVKEDSTPQETDPRSPQRTNSRTYCWRLLSAIQILGFAFCRTFFDPWNFMDVSISFAGTIGVALSLWYRGATSASRIFLSISSIMMWFKFLYFVRPFSSVGPMVVMVMQVTHYVRHYILALLFVLLGFGQAFWLLSSTDESSEFGTFGESIWSSFMMVLNPDVPDFPNSDLAIQRFSKFLVSAFLVVAIVVLLNILIGLMGDQFNTLRPNAFAIWRREQLRVAIEAQREGSVVDDDNYIHVLKSVAFASQPEIPLEESWNVCKTLVRDFSPLKNVTHSNSQTASDSEEV